MPPSTEDLRQWSGVLIDGLIAYRDDVIRLSGQQAGFWQMRLILAIEKYLQPVLGGLPARRWLVHARHRTHARPGPAVDRQLYQVWVPHLVFTVREIIAETAVVAARAIRADEEPVTAAHLLQARHTLQHACRRLNDPPPDPKPARRKRTG
ncbi:hypothetical protein OG462_42940 [Streptomyces sp. NBC_01077]|uniref:hypothetical protein n=1 Tax=Streptomyces sp. NBC_01077 TaxID=2903746 RepID=UPI00386F3A92|nr:hypothetical protein OG462_02065 [Streptomyces sp. NBC_01077]WSV43567.1 hypothetical protein OG462_42940 [Streptomyces sp. NBC_01077]